MVDKNKSGGDEYQFPHDEYVAAEDESHLSDDPAAAAVEESHPEEQLSQATAKKNVFERFSKLKNKRIVVVIGVAVVALIGFKILSPSHSVTVVKKAPVVSSEQQVQQDALMSKLSGLSRDVANNQATVAQLQNEVSELKSVMNKSNQNNKDITGAIGELAKQVDQLSAQLERAAALPKHLKKLPLSPVITYHLRAIIPGRAWIEGSNGVANSVTVGMPLKNYGTVIGIDTKANRVLTSSGKVITYNNTGN